MRGNFIGFGFLASVILLTVYGQLSVKWRLNQLPSLSSDGRPHLIQLLSLLLDPVILSGLVAAFLASIAWLGTLKRFDFGFAYPFISLNLPLAILLSAWLLHESLSVQRLVGVLVIMAGTIIAARG
jgi:drug/metabolite transporter (DMT)-like permease